MSHPGANPLRGVLSALGSFLHFVFGGFFRWIGRHLFDDIGHGLRTVFGSWWPLPAGTLVVLAGALGVVLVWRRRAAVTVRTAKYARRISPEQSSSDLERLADDAARNEDFESSIRLRFRAGVLGLVERGVLTNGPTRTQRQLLAALSSPSLAPLAHQHERIVYGRESATRDDDDAAQSGWRDVFRHELRVRDVEATIEIRR